MSTDIRAECHTDVACIPESYIKSNADIFQFVFVSVFFFFLNKLNKLRRTPLVFC
jgi:hypothetical protein